MPDGRLVSRRSLLLAAGVLGAGCSSRPDRPPNILFCIADDHSYPHTSAYGAKFLKTPAFDRVAREGILFHNAFVSTPSCCPSRGSVLSGRDFYLLKDASMNHTVWPGGIEVYPDLLAGAGYHVGFTGKGWGPGNWKISGRQHAPCGPDYNRRKIEAPAKGITAADYAGNMEEFLAARPDGAPFCFWVGFNEPHRPFEPGAGVRLGKKLEDVEVPGFFPDAAEVRTDIADYALEIEWYDRQLDKILRLLDGLGAAENTIVVLTADNGMAFPRAKANLYDYGTRMPLAIRWGARVKPGRAVQDFVSFRDFAPTFLDAAGLPVPAAMTGRSLIPVLLAESSGQIDPKRDCAVFGLERHFPGSRPDGAGYPCRAIRTKEHLYIRNLEPERSPSGDQPGPVWPDDDKTGGFGDTDGGLTKSYMVDRREQYAELFRLAFERRPAEELYDLRSDPFQLKNLVEDPALAGARKELSARLSEYLRLTDDPRAIGRGSQFDEVMKRYPLLGSNT
jgi:uncharacterized sulfatase